MILLDLLRYIRPNRFSSITVDFEFSACAVVVAFTGSIYKETTFCLKYEDVARVKKI